MTMIITQYRNSKLIEPKIEDKPVTWNAKIPKSIDKDGCAKILDKGG